MRNRFDYMVIREKDLREIAPIVRRFMYDGWVPTGPIVPDHRHYLQAMVRFE